MTKVQLSAFILSVIARGCIGFSSNHTAQSFPYGSAEGDTFLPKGDDGNSGEIPISNIFTFFGVPYESLFVNINGAVSFSKGIESYTPERFPLGDDRVIIAPFWTDIDTSAGLGHGDVMYRQLLLTNQTLPLFDRANRIVRNAYADQNTFTATWMFIVTWDSVAYFDALDPAARVNTFQCILLTDGDFCGVIMVYDDIDWDGDESGDESIAPTSDTDDKTAQAGFNAGDNINYYMIEISGPVGIIDIETRSNIDQPGTWVFRVDGVDIVDAACQKSDEQLTVYPKVVPMLGGSQVFISVPCLNPSSDVIQCDFGGAIVNGAVTSTSIATCVTPVMFASGVIDVHLSLDGGSTFPYAGTIIVDEGEPSPVTFSAAPNGNLTITWNPTELDGVDAVEVVVYEFSSDPNNFISWEPVYNITRVTSNEAGRLEVTVSPQSETDDSSLKVGALSIIALDTANQSLERRAIWSEIHPLNWLYPINMTSWCNSWITRELNELNQWLPQRPVCPCTERQARRDIGSFTVSLDCRLSRTDKDCSTDRPGATFCVNSNFPSHSGAGQECCYNRDGHLIELDAIGAGFSHRQHERVTSPYLSAGLGPLPVLSHYLADTMPYLQCCVADQSENEQFCDLYRTVRPPNSCYGYRPPQPALAFGDPHFITFDGLNYTFNGYDEFTLANLNEDEFILQARSLPMKETPNATIFTAVAAKTNTSDVIHVEANQRRGMTVLFRRDGRYFEEMNLDQKKTWYLRGVTVKAEDDLRADGLSVVFDNGIALKMTTHDDALTILVTVPNRFKYNTQGMLGTWNDDQSDDLQRPDDDVIIPATSSMETIFHEFGNLWRVKKNESLFYYMPGYNQSSYTNYNYTPSLIDPKFLLDSRIRHVCGTDQLCAFDLLVSGSEGFASQTLNAISLYRSTSNDLIPVTCPSLTLANGRMISTESSPGSLATFRCDPCYELRGPNNTTCASTGTWLYPIPSCKPIELDCDTPLAPPNGHVMVGGCPIIYATFTCKGGYDLVGTSMMECMADGHWSNSFPVCKKMGKGMTMTLSTVHAAAIGGGTAVFLLFLCLTIACLVTRQRHLQRKRELKKRASNTWSTTRNPLYDPKS
eukprot:XP_001177888.3 PREDICTED: sushi domain-containing protein 2 isoform X1 [Strongylocentrotus purpuratus]